MAEITAEQMLEYQTLREKAGLQDLMEKAEHQLMHPSEGSLEGLISHLHNLLAEILDANIKKLEAANEVLDKSFDESMREFDENGFYDGGEDEVSGTVLPLKWSDIPPFGPVAPNIVVIDGKVFRRESVKDGQLVVEEKPTVIQTAEGLEVRGRLHPDISLSDGRVIDFKTREDR